MHTSQLTWSNCTVGAAAATKYEHFSPVRLLEDLGEDHDTFLKLADLFLSMKDRHLSSLRAAQGDADKLRSEAHALKGSIAIFDARAAVTGLEQIEASICKGNLSRVTGLLPEVLAEVDNATSELKRYCDTLRIRSKAGREAITGRC